MKLKGLQEGTPKGHPSNGFKMFYKKLKKVLEYNSFFTSICRLNVRKGSNNFQKIFTRESNLIIFVSRFQKQ
eukprot:UN17241